MNPFNPTGSEAILSGNLTGMGIYGGQGYLVIQDFKFSQAWLQCYYYAAATQTNHVTIQRNYFSNAYGTWCALAGYHDGSRPLSYITIQNNRFENFGVGDNVANGLNLVYIEDLIVKENSIGHLAAQSTLCDSANNVEMHYLDRFIFEKNDSYSRGTLTPQQQRFQTGLAVKEFGNINGIIRFNKFHGFQDVEGRGLGINWIPTTNIYVYGNLIYDNFTYGLDVFDGATDIYIWANVFYDLVRAGFVTWERGSGSVDDIYFYNNTFYNVAHTTAAETTDQSPLSIKSGTDVNIKNNLIVAGGCSTSSYSQFNKSAGITLGSLEHNSYYISGQTPQWYWENAFKSFAEMQALGYENDAVAGSVADPLFVDASNDDFTLTGSSPAIDTGEDLSTTITPITIQGVSYSLDLADGLHPSFDLSDANPVNWITATAKQGDYGAGWERGAYVYTPSRKSGMKYGFGLGL